MKNLNLTDYKFIDKHKKETSIFFTKANYYILDFWFLNCLPCRNEHKIIQKKYNQLFKNKIETIGISIDDYSEKWKEYLTSNHYEWPNYLQTPSKKITETLSIKEFPFYVLIKNNGEIIGRYKSFSEILKWFKLNQ